jgi:hypothetical protein
MIIIFFFFLSALDDATIQKPPATPSVTLLAEAEAEAKDAFESTLGATKRQRARLSKRAAKRKGAAPKPTPEEKSIEIDGLRFNGDLSKSCHFHTALGVRFSFLIPCPLPRPLPLPPLLYLSPSRSRCSSSWFAF